MLKESVLGFYFLDIFNENVCMCIYFNYRRFLKLVIQIVVIKVQGQFLWSVGVSWYWFVRVDCIFRFDFMFSDNTLFWEFVIGFGRSMYIIKRIC